MSNNTKNGNKICGCLCIELKGSLASPLSVGSGEQEETDMDVILDSKGTPFIPGSALAGALRAYTEVISGVRKADQLFGTPKNGTPGAENDRQSRIFVYDTPIENAQLGIRDGVKLGEVKTPEWMSKYEIQIIERDAGFKIRLEVIQRESLLREKSIEKLWDDDLKMVWKWVHAFSLGELRLGARSRRGFGRLKIDQVKVKKFHMEEKDSYLEWLDWDWELPDAFSGEDCTDCEEIQRRGHCMEIPLHIPYTLLIRAYSIAFGKTEEMLDYGQLTVGGMGEQAVIPGSSIAGAFRSHIAKIIKEIAHLNSWEEAQCKLEPFFGTWKKNNEKNKRDRGGEKNKGKLLASHIIFEEAVVDGGHGFPVSRNAIDRFTGGTVDKALYGALPWAEGDVLLRILWTGNQEGETIQDFDRILCGMLIWAILDLQAGILPIGGETAVGRGIFSSPEKTDSEILFDGERLTSKEKEQYMQKAAQWARQLGVCNDLLTRSSTS